MGSKAITLICRMSPSWAGQPRRTRPVRVSRSTMKPEEKPATTLRPLGLTAKERTRPGFSPPPSRNSCCRRREIVFKGSPHHHPPPCSPSHSSPQDQEARPSRLHPWKGKFLVSTPSQSSTHRAATTVFLVESSLSFFPDRCLETPSNTGNCTPPDLQARLPAVHKAQGGVRAGHGDAGVGSRHDSYSGQGHPAV